MSLSVPPEWDKPEGEAPLRRCSKFGHRCNCAVDCDPAKPHPSMAATLSPLCGAQNAAGGAPRRIELIGCIAQMADQLRAVSPLNMALERAKAILATQQAAAPSQKSDLTNSSAPVLSLSVALGNDDITALTQYTHDLLAWARGNPVQHADSGKEAADAERVDAIITALYRRFKDWSKRGFSADDVTWCEVKADVIALIETGRAALAAQSQGAQAPCIIGGQRWSKEAEMTEGWLVAQQAAAPGALNDLGALRRLIECAGILDKRPRPMCRDCADEDGTCPNSGLECDMRALIAKTKALYNRLAAPSAPGTPEAPDWERFAMAVLVDARDNLGSDVDGGMIQEAATDCGLLVKVVANESCGENCACAEADTFPQDCYRYSKGALKAIRNKA